MDESYLSEQEKLILKHWSEVASRLKEDLANLWTEEVKSGFETIKKEVKKIKGDLIRFKNTHTPKTFTKYMKDIDNLSYTLNNPQASQKWVGLVYNQLTEVMRDIEKVKIDQTLGSVIRGWLWHEKLIEKRLGMSKIDKIYPWIEKERELKNPHLAITLFNSFSKNSLDAKSILPHLRNRIEQEIKDLGDESEPHFSLDMSTEKLLITYMLKMLNLILKLKDEKLIESLERLKPRISLYLKG